MSHVICAKFHLPRYLGTYVTSKEAWLGEKYFLPFLIFFLITTKLYLCPIAGMRYDSLILYFTVYKNNFLFLERLLYYYFMVCISRACLTFVCFVSPSSFSSYKHISSGFWSLRGNSLFHSDPTFCLLQTRVWELQP